MTKTPQIDALPGMTPLGFRDASGDIFLKHRVTQDPDFTGWNFYVDGAEGLFDAGRYAEAYGLERSEINDRSIKAVQDAAGGLSPGQWLVVWHRWEGRP